MRTFESRFEPAALAEHLRTGRRSAQRLGALLDRPLHAAPARPAVADERGDWSYAELTAAVRQAAAGLRRLGVGTGDRVLVQAPNSREVLALFLACWRVGAVVAPVVDLYRESEVRRIIEAIEPAAIVAIPEHRGFAHAEMFDDLVAGGAAAVPRIAVGGARAGWHAWDDLGGPAVEPAPVAAEDPALILFTSGTTSAPKAVVHSSASLVAEAMQAVHAWRWTWADTSHVATPLAHVSGIVRAVLAPLWAGGSVVLRSRWVTERVVDDLASAPVTFLGVPGIGSAGGMLGELLDAIERRPGLVPALRTLVASGTPDDFERAEAMGLAPGQHYGMSELPTITTLHPDDPFERRVGTAGKTAFGVDVRVVDDTGTALPVGSVGELVARGPEQMLGYLDPADDAAVWTTDGWIHTGDAGRVDADGYVTVTGRLKEIINRGGEKFSVLEIEEHLAGHPSIAEIAVVPAPDDRLGEVPAAFVVLRDGTARPVGDDLALYLRGAGLARQKVPVHFRFVDELPRTASGKVSKGQLRDALTLDRR